MLKHSSAGSGVTNLFFASTNAFADQFVADQKIGEAGLRTPFLRAAATLRGVSQRP